MEFFGYSFRDLNRKIHGTIFLRDVAPWQFRQIYTREEVDTANQVVSGFRLGRNGRWEQTSYPYSVMGEISFYQPVVVFINCRGAAHYMIRNVSKQYSLGFNINNYVVGKGFQEEKNRVGSGRFFIDRVHDPLFIKAVVDNTFFSFEELMGKIVRGEILSGAISPDIAICQSLHYDHPLISYKDKVVGYINLRTRRGCLFSPAEYIQELLPFNVSIQETSNALTGRY